MLVKSCTCFWVFFYSLIRIHSISYMCASCIKSELQSKCAGMSPIFSLNGDVRTGQVHYIAKHIQSSWGSFQGRGERH